MTLVTGQVRLPYGSPEGTGADGCVSFTQSALGSRQGAIFVPASISTPIEGGVMTPVQLTPGVWKVIVKVAGRSHALPDVLVDGEEIALTANELVADGTYTLTLEKIRPSPMSVMELTLLEKQMAETQQIIKGLLPSGKTPSTQKAEILELISQNAAQVGIPIFPTLAEAQAWEAKNPGKTALTTEPQTPDTAPPSAGTLAVTPSNTSAMLTVTGARDDRTVAGYSFRVGSGTWSPWQASASYTATGLTPTTGYTFTHRVKDAAENITVGAPVQATTTATPALKPGDIFTSDTFTGTGSLVGQMTSAALGGTPVKWGGAAGMTVEGGKAVASASAAGKAILAAGLADVKLEFTLVSRPSSGELGITLRDALNVNRNIRIGIGPSLLRVQRYDPSGSTVISGGQTIIGAASDGTKVTITLKGERIMVTGQGNVSPYTIDVTDSVVLGPGAITISAPAGSGAALDDLVVTAQ